MTAFGQAIELLRIGNGFAEGTTVGPLINEAAAQRAGDLVADALAKGAAIAAIAGSSNQSASFVPPMLITGAATKMRIAHEECFAPIAPIFRFETEDQAIALANATPYGLAAYSYTRDASRAWRVADALNVGMVGLNSGSVSTEVAPFGGTGLSGFGPEGGVEGIAEYLQVKALHWGGIGFGTLATNQSGPH